MALSRTSKPRAQRNSGSKESNEVHSLQAEVQRLEAELVRILGRWDNEDTQYKLTGSESRSRSGAKSGRRL